MDERKREREREEGRKEERAIQCGSGPYIEYISLK